MHKPRTLHKELDGIMLFLLVTTIGVFGLTIWGLWPHIQALF